MLVGYLLTCGDVESNPGPGTGQEAGYNGRAQGKEAKRGVHTQPAQQVQPTATGWFSC